MPPIRNQSVLVIGGSSGIGAAVATLAASEGARVFIASSNPARVSKAAQKIRTAAAAAAAAATDIPGAASRVGEVSEHVVDVAGPDAEAQLERLFGEVVAANNGGEPLDHVVYTAAVVQRVPLSEVTAEWVRTALLGQFALVVPLLLGKLAPRFLRPGPRSSLTVTSGRIAERPVSGFSTVAGFGTGILGIAKTLALELAPLRVNVVSPGTTDTEARGPDGDPGRKARMAAAAEASLLGKVGAPEEVAEAYVYLMKDTNSTGVMVSTSGGALLQ